MKDERKTKAQLIEELNALRQQLADARQAPARSMSSEVLESIYHDVGIGLFIVDVLEGPRYQFVWINPTHEGLVGLSSEQVEGCSPQELEWHFGPEAVSYTLDLYDRCVRNRTPIESVAQVDFPGPGDWWLSKLTPLVDDEGRVIRLVGSGTVITAQKKSEGALDEQRRLLAQITANLPNVYLSLIEPDMTVSFIAGQLFAQMGLDPVKYVGLPLDQLLGEQAATVKEHYRRTMQGEETSFELELRGRQHLFKAVPLYSEEGQVNRILAVVEDITERKRTEQALRQSEARLAKAEEVAHVGAWDYDVEHDRPTWSAEMFRIFDRDPALGPPCWAEHREMIHPDCWAEMDQAVAEAAKHATPYSIEFGIVRPDGEERRGWTKCEVETDAAGRVVRLHGTLQDITERRACEERFRTYVDAAPHGIFIANAAGKYVDVNPAACALLEYTKEELLKLSIPDILPADGREESLAEFQELKRSGRVHTERPLLRKDGSFVHVSLEAVALSADRLMAFCTDISGRLQIEEGRRSSEQRFRAVFQHSPFAIALVDLEGRPLLLNPAFTAMLGYELEELRGREMIELTHPEDRERQRSILGEVFSGQQDSFQLEKRDIHKDGHSIWVSLNSMVIRDPAGRPEYLVALAEDITARKGSFQALAQSEEKFRALFYNSPDVVAITDRVGKILDINTVAPGYDKEQVVGTSFTDYHTPGQRVIFSEAVDQALATGETQVQELTLVSPGGACIRWNNRISVLDIPKQEFVISCTDITKSWESAQALQRSKERFRQTLDLLPAIIGEMDLEGRITYTNRLGLTTFDVAWPEVEGGEIFLDRFIHPDDCARARENIAKVIGGERNTANEYRLVDGQGGGFHASIRSAPIIRDGALVGIRSTIIDISREKQLQASIAQSDRLASMGMLAAGVAHEINNPLTYVLYNLESISEDLSRVVITAPGTAVESAPGGHLGGDGRLTPELLADLRQRANDAVEGAERVKGIVRELKTFTRVEEDLDAPVELNSAINTALNMAHNEIKYRARLVKDLSPLPTIIANEGKLAQVFLNILINAAHAITEGDLEHNEIRVRSWQDHDMLVVEVGDTGSGMTEEVMHHIFDPFFTTKGVGVGSGLGLSICRNIIKALGGEILVASQSGEGTQFLVRIPTTNAGLASELASAAVPSSVGSGRLLIVDDEPHIGRAMARMLEEYDTITLTSGERAMEILTTDQSFDGIICDLMMPEVSGMDLHQWLIEHHPALVERVMYITGGAFTPRAQEFLRQIKNPQLEKPFTPGDLQEMVQALLGLKRSLER